LLLKNVRIFTESETILHGSLFIKDGKINKIIASEDHFEELAKNVEIIDGKCLNLIPGFIDGHIHGAAGADVMDATTVAIDTIAAALPQEGTTSFLGTTITQSPKNIEKALRNVADYVNKVGQAELIGIHLEGPFIEKSKAGAQPIEYIIKPSISLFEQWQTLSGNSIKTITLAPEHDLDGSFIKYLNESGVNVSAGHTQIDFEGTKRAISIGVRQLTHLCNAMTGIHHRDIGAVGAAFQLKDLHVEIIADGIHVSPEMLQLIYDNIGSGRINLITDAMRAKYLEQGEHELGGQPVIVTKDRAVLKHGGALAGSIVKMHESAQNMLRLDGVSLTNIVQMASVNPAKQIGIFDVKGSIREGKDADLLLVDDELNIMYTICRGAISYKRSEGNESY
jgi:N-acetylglucosamine-6-phosphate deacetylase